MTDFLSGFVAIVGPPNVGKSTLLNALLGSKVAIVSPKPQTTRNRVVGVRHGDGFQMVFVDTPGIHSTKTALHKSMVESAQAALSEVDIILLVIEMGRPGAPEIPAILAGIKAAKRPCVLAVNKIDRGSKEQLLPVMAEFGGRHLFEAVVPISALKGDGLDLLLRELKGRLAPGPPFFPPDMKTDQTEAFFVSEVIREKIYFHTRRELPYSSAVTVEKIEEIPEKQLISISARIHVETDSQKKILIGRGGQMIKAIGRAARTELEKRFNARVYLDLFVRVEKNWSGDTRALRRLGY